MILSAFLTNLKCRWLRSSLADFEKHQTLAFLLMVDVLSIKNTQKKTTTFFYISSEAHAKLVECILFYLNVVAQNQYNLISPFCDKNVSRLLRISGFNVKALKINLTALLYFFYNFQMSSYG